MEVDAHEIQNLDDNAVTDGIEDLVARAAVHEDLFGAQDAEVLRDVGLLHAELFDERPGGEFAFAQEFQNGDAGWMAEGLEDVSFEAAEGVWHDRILAYSNTIGTERTVSGSVT